jgi:hypothetical protein
LRIGDLQFPGIHGIAQFSAIVEQDVEPDRACVTDPGFFAAPIHEALPTLGVGSDRREVARAETIANGVLASEGHLFTETEVSSCWCKTSHRDLLSINSIRM